jgi:N-carbamoylputrescine amidase
MQVPLVASNRIGNEIIETEHGKSEIKFYGNSFIAGNLPESILFGTETNVAP